MQAEDAEQRRLAEEERQGTEYAHGIKGMIPNQNHFKACTAPGEFRNIWFADTQIDPAEVVDVCNMIISNGRKVHVIAGVHGDNKGNLIEDEKVW